MKLWIRLFAFVAALILVTGCSLDVDNSSSHNSSIRLKLPESFTDSQGKVQAASTSACFAINIFGKNIDLASSVTTCDPKYGMFVGLVPAGKEVFIEGIPKDDGHTIEIYYLSNSSGCQPLSATQLKAEGFAKKFGSNNVHRIASQAMGPLSTGDNIITVKVKFPRSNNTFEALGISGAGCDLADAVLSQLPQAASQVVGAGYGTTASGKKVHIRIKNQNIQTTNPTDFSGRLTPYRLGVE